VLQIEEIQLRNIFEPFLELSLVSPSGTTYVWGCVLNATCTPGPTVARGRIYQLRLDGWPSSDTPVRLVFSYPG
jgi:hypothetical protein